MRHRSSRVVVRPCRQPTFHSEAGRAMSDRTARFARAPAPSRRVGCTSTVVLADGLPLLVVSRRPEFLGP